MIAGATTRVRLGTSILLAALRRPVVLAKTAATLDVLSGGRLDLGVGVGWQREEYEAAGLDFGDRGRLLDHTLEVCQRCGASSGRATTSAELTFDGIHMMPKPVARRAACRSGSAARSTTASSPASPASAPGGSRGATTLADLTASIPRMRDGVAGLRPRPRRASVSSARSSCCPTSTAPSTRGDDGRRAGPASPIGVTDVRLFIPMPGPPDVFGEQLHALAGAFDEHVGAAAVTAP